MHRYFRKNDSLIFRRRVVDKRRRLRVRHARLFTPKKSNILCKNVMSLDKIKHCKVDSFHFVSVLIPSPITEASVQTKNQRNIHGQRPQSKGSISKSQSFHISSEGSCRNLFVGRWRGFISVETNSKESQIVRWIFLFIFISLAMNVCIRFFTVKFCLFQTTLDYRVS